MTEERKIMIELTESQARRISDLILFVFTEDEGASPEDEELLNKVLVDNFVKTFGDEFKSYYYEV